VLLPLLPRGGADRSVCRASPAPRAVCTAQDPIGDWNAASQLIAGVSNAAYAGP